MKHLNMKINVNRFYSDIIFLGGVEGDIGMRECLLTPTYFQMRLEG